MMIENEIGQIGYKRSGVGSGELDYSITPHRISKLNEHGLKDLENTLNSFHRRLSDYIYEAKHGKPKYRFFDLGFFKHMWQSDDYYNLYPIKFKLSDGRIKSQTFFQGHGFQVGYKNGRRTFGWTIHFGRFLIVIGDRKTKDAR